MRIVSLTQGFDSLVDDEDFERVSALPWHILRGRYTFYAVRRRPVNIGMHNFITGWSFVDHIDGNGLNNQKTNLRQATQAQNNANSRKRTTSPYKGIYRNPKGHTWIANIRVNGKTIYLGSFKDPIDAALAYDEAARIHHKEFARVNFPREGEVGALI